MIFANDSYNAVLALECERTDNYGELPVERIYTCADCGTDIYDGEDCLVCDSGIFCRRCIMAMTSDTIVELLGFKFKTADKKDIEV